MRLTFHAKQRIDERLNNLTSCDEVLQAVKKQANDADVYKTIIVKNLGHMVVIPESTNYQECSKGDSIVAIARQGNITTVMLRKSTSKSDNYKGE